MRMEPVHLSLKAVPLRKELVSVRDLIQTQDVAYYPASSSIVVCFLAYSVPKLTGELACSSSAKASFTSNTCSRS